MIMGASPTNEWIDANGRYTFLGSIYHTFWIPGQLVQHEPDLETRRPVSCFDSEPTSLSTNPSTTAHTPLIEAAAPTLHYHLLIDGVRTST
jgi:hypothetical protein